jgi:hypothetical protein
MMRSICARRAERVFCSGSVNLDHRMGATVLHTVNIPMMYAYGASVYRRPYLSIRRQQTEKVEEYENELVNAFQ